MLVIAFVTAVLSVLCTVTAGNGKKRPREIEVEVEVVQAPPVPPPVVWHLPGWFTQVHQQVSALQNRLLEHLTRQDEISDLIPPCEAAIVEAEQTEHCCNNPGPYYLTDEGLVATNTHCETCGIGLRERHYETRSADPVAAQQLRDEADTLRRQLVTEQNAAQTAELGLLLIGCPHPVWEDNAGQLVAPWSPRRWLDPTLDEHCHWCNIPRTWVAGAVTAGPQFFGDGTGTSTIELAIHMEAKLNE